MVSWQRWRSTVVGCTVVLTNGCFDLIHYGHVQLLQAAKFQQDTCRLVVGVNSDNSVRELKGPTRPVNPEAHRLAVIAALECVDYCVIFDSLRCDKLIRTIKPDVWVKGGDYTLATLDAAEVAAANKCKTQIKILPYEFGISTTDILNRAAKRPASAFATPD